MSRHCEWCGRFVSADAEPITGVNALAERRDQLLCPDCGPSWRDLSDRNAERLAER
jgi:hypothetical protein